MRPLWAAAACGPHRPFLHRWLVTLAAGGSIAWLTAALLSGMRLEAHPLLALAIGTRMAVLVTAMILTGRAAPTNDVPGPRRARGFAVCPHREHARVRAV
jgi:hypothetical protein